MKRIDRESAYNRAKNRVDKLGGFYRHLVIYLLVNTGISLFKVIRNVTHGESFSDAFFDLGTFFIWIPWGLGLAIHALSVFGLPHILGRNWEEEKIKKFMEDEENYRIK